MIWRDALLQPHKKQISLSAVDFIPCSQPLESLFESAQTFGITRPAHVDSCKAAIFYFCNCIRQREFFQLMLPLLPGRPFIEPNENRRWRVYRYGRK